MHQLLDTFAENMASIIAFMFLLLKLKEFLVTKSTNTSYLIWLSPIAISILSMYVMHHPFEFEGMRVDLRGVPLFFIAYLGGWKVGLLSILLPTWYRLSFEGPTVIAGIILAIILPVIIGSLFHNKKGANLLYRTINLKHMLIPFTIYQLIKSIVMVLITHIGIELTVILLLFETIAIISIGLMVHDTGRNFIVKKELEFQSRRDSMTNLYNLRYYKSKAELLIQQKKRFVIAMLDVDYFKNYNDTHGHPAGDTVLRNIGLLLNQNVRRHDIFARYGGEEFIICLPITEDRKEGIRVVEQLRQEIEEFKFYGEETQPTGNVTVSICVSTESEGKTLDELINEADRALYHAKRKGRNTVVVYD